MKIDAHPPSEAGDSGVQRSVKLTHERDKRKGTHKALSASIISFNPSEDIEGERERETLLTKRPGAASSLSAVFRALASN